MVMGTDSVTVAVLCYNAEKTVVETLNSIQRQTYNRIQLIINDDGSSDNSVVVINDWIETNKTRFESFRVFEHKENRGINWSFDFVMNNCNTKWVKIIGSDDVLLEDCIEKNLNYVQQNNVNTMVISQMIPFKVEDDRIKVLDKDKFEISYAKRLCSLDAGKQYKKLLKRDLKLSPTEFINADLYKKFGGISLEIRNIEDWPLRLLYTKNSAKIYFLDEDTVLYRIADSVSHSSKTLYNSNHLRQTEILKRTLIYPNIRKWDVIYYFSELIEKLRIYLIVEINKNQINKKNKIISNFLMIFELQKLPERIFRFFMN